MLEKKMKTFIVGGGGGLGGGNSDWLKLLKKAMKIITDKHIRLGGEGGFLGGEVSDLKYCDREDGFYKHFAGGSIFWNKSLLSAYEVHGAIREKWKSLGWEKSILGFPITDETPVSDGQGRFNHFQGGSIYWSPSTGAFEVNGAIRDKWASLGWEQSFLGYPISDELDFDEGGRISLFQHGAIYWWPDVGAIELRNIAIQYTGINCFGETNEASASDEPYVVFGTITPGNHSDLRTRVYKNVDSGESQLDLIEIYRGKATGIIISVLLMEHDEGDPDKYRKVVRESVTVGLGTVTTLLNLIPVVGTALSVISVPIFAAVAPDLTDAINEAIGTGDDQIGYTNVYLSPKQMVLLAAKTGTSWERGVSYKVVTPLLSGDGASYKVYLNLVPA